MAVLETDLLEARKLYASGRLSDAEAKLQQILSDSPENPQARVTMGVVYAKTRRHQMAVEILESVLAEFPDQFDSLVWLAVSKKALGQFDEAIYLCERAIDLSPKDPAAYNTLGLCYLSTRRVVPAEDQRRSQSDTDRGHHLDRVGPPLARGGRADGLHL